ncbi:MAG: MBL fold metallo-hydrolase [Alphaproteobacteria bacterium]|nr:MBL fold metallo-hydrolase [Alphaproteobacteria bacterium]
MTLKAAVIPVTPLAQNCTLLWCAETLEGVVIDPGNEVDTILDAVRQTGVTVVAVLLTHGHFDHVGGAMDVAEATGAPIKGPHADDEFLTTRVHESGAKYGLDGGRDITGNAWLNDGDTVPFGNETLTVIHTPGHTPGHVVFYNAAAKVAQVGDVLFKGSIGRTDFPRGDLDTLTHSITRRLWPLGGDVTFIPGHGPTGTFAEERATNPFVGDTALGA